MARPAPGAAQGRGEPAPGGVVEGAATGGGERMRRQVAEPRRGVLGLVGPQRGDLDCGQGPRTDVELVEGTRVNRVGWETGENVAEGVKSDPIMITTGSLRLWGTDGSRWSGPMHPGEKIVGRSGRLRCCGPGGRRGGDVLAFGTGRLPRSRPASRSASSSTRGGASPSDLVDARSGPGSPGCGPAGAAVLAAHVRLGGLVCGVGVGFGRLGRRGVPCRG